MDKNKKQNKSAEVLELENQLKKALSDYSNLERDIDRRIELRSVQLKMQLAMQLMEVLDAGELAMKAKAGVKLEGELQAWIEGIGAILVQVGKTIESLGIKKMDVKSGDTFDSSMHEAVATLNEGEKGKISEVVSGGYLLGEYIVRPARVVVYQGTAS